MSEFPGLLSDEVIRVCELCAVFPNGNGGLHALENLSFSVNSQEFLCVLGPSGSGKSTLLRILAGLLPPTTGEVFYNGKKVIGPQKGTGFVFQKANLMPWRTVVENITLPLELEGLQHAVAVSKAQEMVELVGLKGFEQVLPRDLSGGMAQRVAIGRALVQDPQVLLLDEPFGALDALTRERMGSELLRIWQLRRKTVIMVTHSIVEALYLADRVIVLSQRPGKICLELDVCLPRPRHESIQYTSEFGDLADRVRAAIGDA
ncbi:MAG TPA: ABC transporter ATP-binding protein [Anaerolineales bacterium]|nr:ABC transporter ATP-binding protein [Anaerolineales bacterium]